MTSTLPATTTPSGKPRPLEPTAFDVRHGFVEWVVYGLSGYRRRSLSHVVGEDGSRTLCGVPIPAHDQYTSFSRSPHFRGTVCWSCSRRVWKLRGDTP